jgi:hypothetical protein
MNCVHSISKKKKIQLTLSFLMRHFRNARTPLYNAGYRSEFRIRNAVRHVGARRFVYETPTDIGANRPMSVTRPECSGVRVAGARHFVKAYRPISGPTDQCRSRGPSLAEHSKHAQARTRREWSRERTLKNLNSQVCFIWLGDEFIGHVTSGRDQMR